MTMTNAGEWDPRNEWPMFGVSGDATNQPNRTFSGTAEPFPTVADNTSGKPYVWPATNPPDLWGNQITPRDVNQYDFGVDVVGPVPDPPPIRIVRRDPPTPIDVFDELEE